MLPNKYWGKATLKCVYDLASGCFENSLFFVWHKLFGTKLFCAKQFVPSSFLPLIK
jgi:hypothetical protein